MENAIVDKMEKTGMIPVFYHADSEIAKGVLDAAYAGGVRVFEFTNRGGNAFDVFKQLLDHGKQYSDLSIGIGTIMDDNTTQKYIDAGAAFIVSPILKPSMSEACKKNNIPWIPGCATPTEIVTAKEAGASVIKIFPGSVLGPGFVSSLLPVIPGYKLMPTGGVEPTQENLAAWFGAGVICVGMGSQLIKKELLASKNWKSLQDDFTKAMALIKNIRA